jgi:hypothetical protein
LPLLQPTFLVYLRKQALSRHNRRDDRRCQDG